MSTEPREMALWVKAHAQEPGPLHPVFVFDFMCTPIAMFMCICLSSFCCVWCPEAKGRCFPQYFFFFFALYLIQTSTEAESCQFRWLGWAGNPRDLLTASSPGRVLQGSLQHLAFLHGIWELNWNLRTCTASFLLTDPTPQPLFWNFWVLSASLWRLSRLRKGAFKWNRLFGTPHV